MAETETPQVEEAGRSVSAANAEKIRSAITSLQAFLAANEKEEKAEGEQESAAGLADVLAMLQEVSEATDPNVGGGVDRSKIDDSDFAGKNRSFPIVTPKDVSDAASSIGRAGADNYTADELKSRIIAIANRKGAAFVAELPAAWKAKESAEPAYTEADIIALRESGALADVSSEVVPLIEKAIRDDGTMPVKLIAPGWGSSGYYSEAMLKRDGPKVFRANTHMYINHPTAQEAQQRPERDIRDLAAVLSTDAVYRDDAVHGPGLYADAKVFSHWRPFVEEVAPFTGTSIRALGKPGTVQTIEGRKGKVIESLLAAQSVDLVTAAGAGGKVLQLFESARGFVEPKVRKEIEVAEDRKPEEWQTQALAEAERARDARIAELEEAVRRGNEREQLREAQDLVRREVGRAELPEQSRARVTDEVLRIGPPLTEAGTVDEDKLVDTIREAVRREAAYVTSLTGGGRIRGMGAGSELGYTEDQVKASEARLEESFKRFGMTPEAAKIAAAGRR
jgi:hypothetical protein